MTALEVCQNHWKGIPHGQGSFELFIVFSCFLAFQRRHSLLPDRPRLVLQENVLACQIIHALACRKGRPFLAGQEMSFTCLAPTIFWRILHVFLHFVFFCFALFRYRADHSTAMVPWALQLGVPGLLILMTNPGQLGGGEAF